MSRSKPILLGVLVAALAIVIWRYPTFLGGKKAVTIEASVDPSQIALSNTDDNTGEDLIISSDKKVYEGFNGSTIYFSVNPLQKKSENVGLQFYFTDPKARAVHVYQYQKKDHYWLQLPLNTGAITGNNYSAAMGRKKGLEGKAYIQSNTFYDSTGETEYFMADIAYDSGTPGQFLIEGFGSGGSYGILDPWYNSGWGYRKKITVNPQFVSGSSGQINFPMLFSRTDPDLKYTGSGGHVASSTGGEILFTDADGNKIPHEIEKYASTTGQLIAWVKVPFLSSTSTRDIYIYYGNATIPLANQQDKTNVWDANYQLVWHLTDGSSLSYTDSTSNANNGSTYGGSPSATAGQIDGAANFSGTNDVSALGSAISLSGSYSIDAWFYSPLPDPSCAAYCTLTRGNTEWEVIVDPSRLLGVYSGGFSSSGFDMGTLSTGWHHLTAVGSGGNTTFYIDGKSVGSAGVKSSDNLGYMGNYPFGGTQQFGKVDEFRMSNIARPADWIATDYANESSPNTFYSYSGEGVEIRASTVAGVNVRSGSPATDWYNTAWGYRKKVTVNPQYVGGGESNFPMLFSRTDADLKATASGGNVASTTGGDILFTDSSGNKLSHEIERYTSTTGELIAWVKVPFISSTSTRDFYVYYGNATVPLANQQDKTNVWDTNYKGVWHLPDGTTLGALDSTSGANNGTVSGPTAATGQVDGAASYSGTTDAISVGTSNNLLNIGSSMTASAWIKPNSAGGGNLSRVIHRQGASGTAFTGVNLIIQVNDSLPAIEFFVDGSTLLDKIGVDNSITFGAWQYVTFTWDGSTSAANVHIYVNGKEVSYSFSQDGAALDSTTGQTTYLGNRWNLNRNFDGIMDEVQISNSMRSADWIATEYKNQASPNTFYSYGGQGIGTTSPSTPSVNVRGGVKFR